MVRTCLVVSIPLALAGCIAPGGDADAGSPAWMTERIALAEERAGGTPPVSEPPAYRPDQTSYEAWREGLEAMAATRAAVLADPKLADPDDDDGAVSFIQQSREAADADIERLSDEELE